MTLREFISNVLVYMDGYKSVEFWINTDQTHVDVMHAGDLLVTYRVGLDDGWEIIEQLHDKEEFK